MFRLNSSVNTEAEIHPQRAWHHHSHIAVSKGLLLPWVQQRAKGIVKEAAQCDNWKHSSVNGQDKEWHKPGIKWLCCQMCSAESPHICLTSEKNKKTKTDQFSFRLTDSTDIRIFIYLSLLHLSYCYRTTSLCPHCALLSQCLDSSLSLHCPHFLDAGCEWCKSSCSLHSHLYLPLHLSEIGIKYCRRLGPPTLLYKSTWKTARTERIVP